MNGAPLKLRRALIVGLGVSGLSAARYLHAAGCAVTVIDSRAEPPQRAALLALDPSIAVHTGPFDRALLEGIDALIVSPGVALQGAFFDAARARNLPLIGDIELFAWAANAPVAGITGTNGKSTVTTLVGRMAERGGKRVRVGGNLGEPALQLLDAQAELYVLELSSYQLQSTDSLKLEAATVLNVTPDHLDRYASVEEYAAAKARIFRRCGTAVINADDERTLAMVPAGQRALRFSVAGGSGAEFALLERADGPWLACRGQALLAASELKIAGRHNIANALAALAMGEALGIDLPSRLAALREFTGLPHRTQWVADVRGVRYIDDSKGTNVGATMAAVSGLPAPLLLIAGGEGKGQDFLPLRTALEGKVRLALLIGKDAPALGTALAGVCAIEYCPSLEAAVRRAAASARAGEIVLLSPACASFDMFRDYAHRGAVFAATVRELAA
ncbi:MAG TPA: UDP-N-acetylmuramoyl-L-alanine--D-glutamate ligase [Steroidobacteraceae bacterium]|nr:UDP-N-acetylmuramoyl-L-alanine--D-glutamate ligase [Steroidobacteraceae bacterium]